MKDQKSNYDKQCFDTLLEFMVYANLHPELWPVEDALKYLNSRLRTWEREKNKSLKLNEAPKVVK